ncbi:nucleotide excision repair protein [Viridibacillus arvi]|uniref:nucleotide excision repair protein n=2 Tax=Viridibacillus arvi TaxID=263475 RepID=UPI0036A17073
MICENCKQRPATITVTQMKNGKKTTRHFCEVCNKQLDSFHLNLDFNADPISMHKLFSNWFGTPSWSVAAPNVNEQKTQEQENCPECGMTYHQFLNEGKFNCPGCYETFKEQLPQVLKRLHNGAVEHVGKVPGSINELYQLKRQIEAIRLDMKVAIEEERFEDAAAMRDNVRSLEKKLQVGGESQDEH